MKKLISVVFLILPLFCGGHPQKGKSTSGIECYKCTSEEFPDCAINPTTNLPSSYCKDPEDQCIVAIVGSVTQRGCKKEVKVPLDTISIACATSHCNNKLFPEDRIKCYHCQGKGCVKDFQGTLKPCVNYNKADNCTTNVIDENDVIRGCQSDPHYSDESFVEKCHSSGCNNQSATSIFECVACSGTNSKNCARISTSLPSGQICTVPKDNTCKDIILLNRQPIQCFTYKTSDKVVRGCLKDAGKLFLDSDHLKICQGQLCNNECLPTKCIKCNSKTNPKCADNANELNPELCPSDRACFTARTSEGAIERGCGEQFKNASKIAVCYEDGCNKNVLPVPKLECYNCDSKTLAECATNPSASLPHDQCKEPKDKCVTAIFEGVTYRGCEKEVAPSYSLAHKCDSNLCNIDVYPKNRLKCYQCEGEDCVKDFEKYLKPCVSYDEDSNDNLCVTVVKDEFNIIRKCISDPGYSAPKYAETCKGSGCNNHPATYSTECLSCSQSNATSCARITSRAASGDCRLPKESTCKDTLLLNRPISCFTYEESGRVVRGCTKDAGKLSLDSKHFKTCEGQLCNDECLPIKCVSCDSRKDLRCFNQTNELNMQTCSSGSACFVGQTSDGAIIRSCGEKSKEVNHITPCYFNGCNNKSFPVPIKKLECYKCNSKTLAECATNPSTSLPHDQCKEPKDKCVTAIFEGVTYRGCEKEVAPSYSLAHKCDSNLCNIDVYPKNRLKCYQCEGEDCVKDFEKYLKPCVSYDEDSNDNLCVTVVKDEFNIIRKCISDPGYSAPKYAETCKGSGCNNHPATYSTECLSCSQSNATSCARITSRAASGDCRLSKDATCKDTLLLNRPISCFTYENSGRVVRGCIKDAGKLSLDSKHFKTCEGQLCNDECLPIKCVSCDSRKDLRCFNQTNELNMQTCSSGSACFVGQTSDGAIIRGCGEQSKEANHTTPCYFNGCNNKSFPVPIKKLECYKCNSKTLAECATNPSASLPHDQCKEPKDKCVTAILEGVTYRGCEKEVAPSYSLAHKCDSNLCNIEVFPKNRLKCYQCEGEDCVKGFEKYLKPCVSYDEDNKDNLCVTVVKDESNIIRKCISDPGYSAPKYAETCKGSGCNKHPVTYSAECLSCSQSNATSCARITSRAASGDCRLPKESTCKDTLLLNRPISCFTYENSGRVVRGCTKDAGKLSLDSKHFKTCEGQLCNDECLPIKCVSCDSRKDLRCFNQTNELNMQTCSSGSACFVGQTSDGAIIRGCGEQSKEANHTTPCYFNGCNNKSFPVPIKKLECYKCDSKTLAECATNPSASLPHDQCKEPKDKCVTAILEGVTYRGCEKEVAPSYSLAHKCDSNLCNIEVFPKNRLKCYQCEGEDCVKGFEKYLKPCVSYDEDNKDNLCVTVVKDESNIIRKCISDPGYSAPKYAETCKGSGCNKHPVTYSAECLSCSQSNATSCARITSRAASGDCRLPKESTCKDTLLLNRPISCFTYENSGRVVRGCTKDAGKLSLDSKHFKTCEGQLCNDECLPIKCVSCDSRTNPDCAIQSNNLEPKVCSSNETKCFIGQTPEGAVIRGCGSQSAEVSQIASCSADGCNKVNKAFPTAPKRLQCYKCSSTNLTECANNPSPNLPHDYCNDSTDQCITSIVDGVTYRGCEKEVRASANSISGICNSNLCNVDRFKLPHFEIISQKKDDNYNNNNNNYSNNNNSNNNNHNNIFVQIINFNFDKNNNSSNEKATAP